MDDTPEAVITSGFDPIRREIARLALERLLADGRIHPGRIEDVVEKVKKEMANTLKEEGEAAAFEVGVEDLHPEIIKLLGRLKYRTSYSQNVLQHVKETAFLAGIMAAELGADERLARRAMLEGYIKRLQKLEEIGDSFAGVEKTYAIQAGREIRIVVQPDQLNDAEATLLARDVAKRIEQEMVYPGQIKVTVLRETRATEYAR